MILSFYTLFCRCYDYYPIEKLIDKKRDWADTVNSCLLSGSGHCSPGSLTLAIEPIICSIITVVTVLKYTGLTITHPVATSK